MKKKNMSATNSAVLDLRRYASDSSVPTSDILREAYILSSKLELTDFHQWCDCEMNGYYAEDVQLPDYRKNIRVILEGFHPNNGWNSIQLPADLDDLISYHPCSLSISEIENALSLENDVYFFPPSSKPKEALDILFKEYSEFRFAVNRINLAWLTNKVRNKIIDNTLQLEKEGIMGNNIQITRKKTIETTAIIPHQTFNIEQFQGILGNNNSDIFQNLMMNVSIGNFELLAEKLHKHRVTFDDITTLKQAIDEDGELKANPKDYGTNVKKWFGKMVNKAVDGGWQISVATVGNVLGAALNGYYGIGS